MNRSKDKIINHVAILLNNGEIKKAEKIINDEYPFIPVHNPKRSYTPKQMMKQFFEDGFIDRYSGKHLINPGLLRVISEKMPQSFPYQAHWKTSECHIAFYEYSPTIDHIIPISLGGEDTNRNWATTSMLNNSAKANFTLEQLQWNLKDKGKITEWDGLSHLFIEIVDKDNSLLKIKRIKDWYKVTKEMMEEYNIHK